MHMAMVEGSNIICIWEEKILLHSRFSEAFAYQDSHPSLFQKNLGSHRKSNYPLLGSFLAPDPRFQCGCAPRTWMAFVTIALLTLRDHTSTDAAQHGTYFSFNGMRILLI